MIKNTSLRGKPAQPALKAGLYLTSALAAFLAVTPVLAPRSFGQDVVAADEDEEPAAAIPVLKAPLSTLTEARTLTLAVPAPRGQIVDRNGFPLAQNKVAHYLALKLPNFGQNDSSQVAYYADERIKAVGNLLARQWDVKAEDLVKHYENRRWLPFIFSHLLTPDEVRKVDGKLPSGIILHPVYIRHYPKNEFAAHILGYVGKTRPLPVGPIADGDPLWEETDGRLGIEKSFDEYLQGTNGKINVLFDSDGAKLNEEMIRRPAPGNNVVMTLDANFQQFAENALKRHTRAGAFVIVDAPTGDVLAMASYPTYDANDWIPGISTERFRQLNEDPRTPLLARAFRGVYPPASTFKIPVALAALESGTVDALTTFNCTTSMYIGDRYFHNWNKYAEGHLTVVQAIKRSCNTWFYAAGIKAGITPIASMASRLGHGSATGLPLAGEGKGFMPSNESAIAETGRPMYNGEVASTSIGQARVLATPLQVARMMAAVGNGGRLPEMRLVKQIQDINNRVVKSFPTIEPRDLGISEESIELTIKGMVAVVSAGDGTGKSAAISHAQVAGKTGTGQWKIPQKQNIAWFAGFVPASNPKYAFAVLYEGAPGENVSGGGKAAPMVREVFNNIFENKTPENAEEIAEIAAAKAVPVDEPSAPRARPVQAAEPVEQEPAPPVKKPGFFRRVFGKRR